ncbi:MAG: HAMP domain-containing histidine kinase [Deltaproteobacteria bacterium]|nr:HAMP domain-containing histidine kinase [Deltaproteobacteria bacterium]
MRAAPTTQHAASRAFVLFAIAAVVLLAFMSQRAFSRSQLERERQFRALAQTRLAQVAQDLQTELGHIERDLARAVEDGAPLTVADARKKTREQALIRQAFIVDRTSGALTFPRDDADASSQEREFLRQTRSVFDGSSVLFEATAPETERTSNKSRQRGDTVSGLAAHNEQGWIRRFWDDGQQWLFWKNGERAIVGAHIERIAFLARLAASVNESQDLGRVILRDAKAAVVQQWGGLGDAAVIDELALSPPLDGFRLAYVASREQTAQLVRAGATAEAFSLAAVCVVLALGAALVWREQRRAFVEAQTRVGFVTQVSHELKTPLTNIRLYAELLEREIDVDAAPAQKHLAVITSESQRLSRLIENVLSMSRERTLRVEEVAVDAVVEQTLAQHRPALEQRGFAIATDLQAPATLRTDADALAQILANLLSNVEKYAASGNFVSVATRSDDRTVTIRVRDKGPGVPDKDRERIFEPYVRLDDAITEGASGTGIGLGIARDLARRLGGDLVCVAAENGGAELVLTLPRRIP